VKSGLKTSKGHLIQKKDGLNIQFVLDAFASTDSAIVEPTSIKLAFKKRPA
jgi:hypothetical protein